jgi:hypothetical protein
MGADELEEIIRKGAADGDDGGGGGVFDAWKLSNTAEDFVLQVIAALSRVLES